MAEMQLLGDLMLGGALVMGKNETGFPANPRVGTFVIKDQCLYGYIKLGGLETWYPFASKTNFYIHSQGLPALEWIVQHNLGTPDIWLQVKDQAGNIINVGKEDIDDNSFRLRFTSATAGRVVVVAPDTVNVPQMKASTIEAGGGVVMIDSDGIRVNGEKVLTNAIISGEIDTKVSAAFDPLNATVIANRLESQTALATKSDVGHGHAIADTIGLRAELDSLSQLIANLDSTYATDTDVAGKVAAINDAWAAADGTLQSFIDTITASKADKATTYTKTEVDTSLAAKSDLSAFNTLSQTVVSNKSAADAGLADRYTKAETYTKGEVEALVASAVATAIANLEATLL